MIKRNSFFFSKGMLMKKPSFVNSAIDSRPSKTNPTFFSLKSYADCIGKI
jgi:hypothetical protein